MKFIENQSFDQERALYASENLTVKDCRFDGPADGESALKESKEIVADHCFLCVTRSGTTIFSPFGIVR